jgi:hypothetical protein
VLARSRGTGRTEVSSKMVSKVTRQGLHISGGIVKNYGEPFQRPFTYFLDEIIHIAISAYQFLHERFLRSRSALLTGETAL